MSSGMMVERCPSCDGAGWYTDEETDESLTCDWCNGVGYVYRDSSGVDHGIPPADYEQLTPTLERLEIERLREMGYTGQAKKPWEQDVRRGTQGGVNPYEDDQS
jgi:hypothetical protein